MLDQAILDTVRHLAPEKQQEVLDFAQFLAAKNGQRQPLRSLKDLCADLNVDINAEEIDEARREMWAHFPRERLLMPSLVIDTHVAIWYVTDSSKLSVAALQAIADATQTGMPIFVPSISLVELRYLVEKGRIAQLVLDRINASLDQPGANLEIVALDIGIARALQRVPRASVPDMPDRIIAATALALGLPLISRDRKIQTSCVQTIW